MTSLYEYFYNKEYQERLGRALYPWAFPPEDTLSGADGHPQASDWTGSLTFTPGGTAIIRGEKPESTYSGLKDPK